MPRTRHRGALDERKNHKRGRAAAAARQGGGARDVLLRDGKVVREARHAAFCTTALLAVCSVALILVFVRDKKAAGAAAGAAAGSADVRKAREGAAPGGLAAADPSPTFAKMAGTALAGLTLEQAMNPHAATVRNSATMGEVVELIADTDTTGVSVVDDAGRLVGYVTGGDIMRYLARLELNVANPSTGMSLSVKDDEALEARIAALANLNVMSLATKRVVSVDVSTPLDVATCDGFAKRKIKKMPVTRDGVLIGALSRRNILHSIILNNAPAANNSQVER